MRIRATRYHDFSCGHRVYGHENKCAHLHGHNYRVTFEVEAFGGHAVDKIGRVLDFSVIKSLLCGWLEVNWDHKFLVWEEDPWLAALKSIDDSGVVGLPFNPTAENMAQYLLDVVGPASLRNTGVALARVTVEETRKCAATVEA